MRFSLANGQTHCRLPLNIKQNGSTPVRLDKFIADSSEFSRAEARKRIRAGAVSVNGVTVRAPEWKTEESDAVFINRREIRYRKFLYLMLNKPAGYLSATEDRHGDPVVTDLVPGQWKHFSVFPVGRLDKDTEGLLLLTNDGAFDHALMSPRHDVPKRYYAELDGPVSEAEKALFAAGMIFEDFTAKPALLEWEDDPSKVFITVSEGKFHQVKRMCGRAGRTVLFLKRLSVGGLALDPALKPGEMRELTEEELRFLKRD